MGRALYYPPHAFYQHPRQPLQRSALMQPNLQHHASTRCPQSWTGGLDWFRWRTADFADTRPLLEGLREVQYQDTQRASAIKPWRFQGYEGWHTDSVRYGQRGGNVIWESSGERAASTLGLTELCSGYASRIDLQVTLQLSEPQRSFGTSLLRSITQTSSSRHRTPTLLGCHTANSGLWLGTVGRRTSPSYLRIYDKGVEARLAPPGHVWRVELEAKGPHSRQLCSDHYSHLTDPKFCAAYCVSSLTRSGCSWPLAPFTDTRPNVVLGKSERATPLKLAAWLRNSVAPTIPRLLTVYTVAEVLEMLNLSAAVASTGKDNAQRAPVLDARS